MNEDSNSDEVDHQIESDDNEDYDGYAVANQLLGIRTGHNIRWNPPLSQTNPGGKLSRSDSSVSVSNEDATGELNSTTPNDGYQSKLTDPPFSSVTNYGLSTSKIYEPKFLHVFDAFATDNSSQTVNLNDHLLNMCLDNLVSFCCWARSSNSRVQWIRSSLDDNIDLRPEVRNGLALIIVYVLSAAKGRRLDSEMFTVLQDSSHGLGIVNKTSLKIYNDPFNYFNFIKSCISGLIDAGIIPENERVNQQPKKSKKQLENKEELTAFAQMKLIITRLINANDNVTARLRIQSILSVWQQKNKNIRTRRFTTGLAIMSSSQTSSVSPYVGLGFSTGSAVPIQLNSPSINGSASSVPTIPSVAHLDVDKAAALSAILMNRPHSTILSSSTDDQHNTTTSSAITEKRSDSSHGSRKQLDDIQTNESKSISNESRDSQPPKKLPRLSDSTSMSHNIQPSWPLSIDIPILPIRTVPAIRFERIGMNEWEIHDMIIFNIDTLLRNSITGISTFTMIALLDQNCITSDEMNNKLLKSNLSGFITFPMEIKQRNGLLTTWSISEYAQLKSMLDLWNQLQKYPETSNLTLSSLWLNMNGLIDLSHSNNIGTGVLGYEIVSQIGIILRPPHQETLLENNRMSSFIGEDDQSVLEIAKTIIQSITVDCWRLYYPNDLIVQNDSNISFGDHLMMMFPQLVPLLTNPVNNSSASRSSTATLISTSSLKDKVQNETSTTKDKIWSRIIVKYCSHRLRQPVTKPPTQERFEMYQTLGSLNDLTSSILSRLDPNVNFHDFMLTIQ